MPPSFAQLILGFFDDWYYEKPRAYWRTVLGLIESVDRDMAVPLMVRLFFTPLYGDYTAWGYFLGPLFRLGRILAGLTIYFLILLVGSFLFLAFLIVPAFALMMTILSFLAVTT